jgi:Spy/CpxP family protein refolding chaperone
MKGTGNFKIGVFMVILGVFLLIPAMVQAVEPGPNQDEAKMEQYLKEFRAQIFQQINLSPEKQKAFSAIEDKHAAERQKIVAKLKEDQKKLEEAVAASKPEPAKIKALVHAITQDQDRIFANFKNQRDQELGMLTAEQQGKYLLAMIDWRHAMMEKAMQAEGGKKMGGCPMMGQTPKPTEQTPKPTEETPKPK